jgi:hypothetical protein
VILTIRTTGKKTPDSPADQLSARQACKANALNRNWIC